jgi:hypothetical protein
MPFHLENSHELSVEIENVNFYTTLILLSKFRYTSVRESIYILIGRSPDLTITCSLPNYSGIITSSTHLTVAGQLMIYTLFPFNFTEAKTKLSDSKK